MRIPTSSEVIDLRQDDADSSGASQRASSGQPPAWEAPPVSVSLSTQAEMNPYMKEVIERSKPGSQRKEFNGEEKREIAYLQRKDAEIRIHEAAHHSTGGRYVRGSVNLKLETGPDGKMYAVDGAVDIDTKLITNDPIATLRKARAIRAAAMAPANPSTADRSIAAIAASMESWARTQLLMEAEQETKPEKTDVAASSQKTQNADSSGMAAPSAPMSTPIAASLESSDGIYKLQAISMELSTFHY